MNYQVRPDSRVSEALQDVAVVVVEQAGAGAGQDRSEVDAHLVDEASAQQLAADARAEQDGVLAAGKPDGDLGDLAWAADEGADAAGQRLAPPSALSWSPPPAWWALMIGSRSMLSMMAGMSSGLSHSQSCSS